MRAAISGSTQAQEFQDDVVGTLLTLETDMTDEYPLKGEKVGVWLQTSPIML